VRLQRILSVTKALIIALFAVLIQFAAHAEEQEGGDDVVCNEMFRKPAFVTVDLFEKTLRGGLEPWAKLVTPASSDEESAPLAFDGPYSEGVKVVHNANGVAIVFAHSKRYRTSPVCAVMFLLVKQDDHRYRVDDFIRWTDVPSYSNIDEPEILKLKPLGSLHVHWSRFSGGRRWGFDTDIFYMVRKNRFQQTLMLNNDGCFLMPADPYVLFEQDVEAKAIRGMLRVTAKRNWNLEDGSDQQQSLTVWFRWEGKSKMLVSKDAGKLSLKEPGCWTGAGLPKPPKEQR
jgi:hypothetical protein